MLFFYNSFSRGPNRYVEIWKGSTRLILVNFLFLKSTQNFLQDGDNFVFVAICGGSSHILTGLYNQMNCMYQRTPATQCKLSTVCIAHRHTYFFHVLIRNGLKWYIRVFLFTILTERWRHRRFRFQNEAWCHAETGCHVKSMGRREKHGVFVVILQ